MIGATGAVRGVLRVEGLCVLVACLVIYASFGAGWWVFAAAFLLPDLSFVAYFAGARIGSIAYNAAHSYAGPLASLVAALALPRHIPLAIGIIWCAHIGFDRALGYGLKYERGFGFTHLGPIGRLAREVATRPVERPRARAPVPGAHPEDKRVNEES